MTDTTMTLQDFIEKYIQYPWENFRVWDVLDWLILTVLFYCVYLFCRGRIAGRVTWGLVLLWVFYQFTEQAGLVAVHQLMMGIAPFAVVLLAVIYQPELRDALARLGSTAFGFRSSSDKKRKDTTDTINSVVDAACQIAMSAKDGALIVIERGTPLGDFTDKGYDLDAVVSRELLCNIFQDRTPLHDGAVIIRNNRIVAAGCKLPLSKNNEVVGGMGTRHRAAVGITEMTDCVVVVVSEERHVISIANNGFIKKDYHRPETDFHNDATLKSIQKQLLRDLTRLLTGVSVDDGGKPEATKIKVEFKWGFGLDREDRERRRRERQEAERELERKNRDKEPRKPAAYKVVGRTVTPEEGSTAEETPVTTATEGSIGMGSILHTPAGAMSEPEAAEETLDTPASEEDSSAEPVAEETADTAAAE